MEQIAPIITAAALLIGAVGGLQLRRVARFKEETARADAAERVAHRRLTLLRRIEVWMVERGIFEELPESIKARIETETES